MKSECHYSSNIKWSVKEEKVFHTSESTVFIDTILYRLTYRYQHFRWVCCLHLQGNLSSRTTPNMEVVGSSKMMIPIYQSTGRHICKTDIKIHIKIFLIVVRRGQNQSHELFKINPVCVSFFIIWINWCDWFYTPFDHF